MTKRGNECFVYYPCINSNKDNIFYVLFSYSTPYAFNVPLKGQLQLVEGIIVLISYYRAEKNRSLPITEINQIVSQMCVMFQGSKFFAICQPMFYLYSFVIFRIILENNLDVMVTIYNPG